MNDEQRKQDALNRLIDRIFACKTEQLDVRIYDTAWDENECWISFDTSLNLNINELETFAKLVKASDINVEGTIDTALAVTFTGVRCFPWQR